MKAMAESLKFSLIVAACSNGGIGIRGQLPWRLKNELAYFHDRTTKVLDPSKRNAVIMGRSTYEGIPQSKRPLPDRLNIILTRTTNSSDYPADVLLCRSLRESLDELFNRTDIENVWIVGGESVYAEAMELPNCHRIFLTEIRKDIECDRFFKGIPHDRFKLVTDNQTVDQAISNEEQEENGIKYKYMIYERV